MLQVHQGRWGYYPCAYETYQMLKELNKRWYAARRQAAAWRRWSRKLPHNRVRRPRIHDQHGRVIGYGAPSPIPEPPLCADFCRKLELPSGQQDVVLSGAEIEAAYRLARYPAAMPADVQPLPLSEEEIRQWYARCCQR